MIGTGRVYGYSGVRAWVPVQHVHARQEAGSTLHSTLQSTLLGVASVWPRLGLRPRPCQTVFYRTVRFSTLYTEWLIIDGQGEPVVYDYV